MAPVRGYQTEILIPHDVKTWWNSTYDMLNIALEYHKVIDEIMANKALKMRQYELDDEGWDIIKDLRVLKVSYFFITYIY